MTLKREDILSGRIEALMEEAEQRGLLKRVSVEERQASKEATLRDLGDDDVYVFGYGSLMWNPCIHFADRLEGTVYGYHRSFCFESFTGRGTPQCPGLMLALKPGGSCRGILYRIEEHRVDAELEVL